MIIAVSLMSTFGCMLVPLISGLLISGLPVQVHQTDGVTHSGTLVGVADSAILLEQSGPASELGFDSIISLEATAAIRVTPPAMRVTLAGGSELAAQSVTLADDTLKIELRRQDELSVPVRRVRAIRFRAASPVTDAQWLGMFESVGSGDLLAIRRDADRLDQIRGIIESIAENVVNFNVDGNQVQAPFDRLEGVVFGSSSSLATLASVQVVDAYGSRWMADSLRPSSGDEPIRLSIESDIKHDIPLNQVNSIRWNSSLVLLTLHPAAEKSFKPVIGSAGLEPAMTKWFGPAPINDDDLLMHGDSTIDYRIEPGFERVAGSFRRDGNVDRTGKVTVSIALDGKSVWTQELNESEPSGFDISILDHRRLQFRVDSAGDGDLGDTVRISRPRLLK